MRSIDADDLRKNMEFICMGIMAGTEPYNSPLTEIDNAPTVGEWIPVSERLPEYSGLYIVSVDDVVLTANFDGKYFSHIGGGLMKVYAWMPLPQPYKE